MTETRPSLIICGGGTWSRVWIECPWCQERRQAIRRLVFGGYGQDAVCGWCGTWLGDTYTDCIPESERDHNRELVKRVWSRSYKAVPWKKAMRDLMREIAEERRHAD